MRYYQLFKNKPSVNDQQTSSLSKMDIGNIDSNLSEAKNGDKSFNAAEFRKFISTYPGTRQTLSGQDINTTMYPVMMHMVPVGKFIGVSKFDQPATLVSIEGSDYIFQSGETVETFSASKNDSDNLMQFRVIFENTHEYSKFMTLLILKFAGWKITEKVL